MMKRWHVALALLIGVFIGWFTNEWLSSRYVLHFPEGSRWRIDSRTGKTWIMRDDGWELLPEKPN